MGKETKIGLTVIVVLLVGLGVTIANRLASSEEEPVASYSQGKESGTSKEDRATTKDDGLEKTTVLTPKATAISPPKSSPSTGSPWNIVSDKGASRQGRSSTTVAVSPPSYMPKPPTVVSAAPTPRYGGSGASTAPTSNPLHSGQTRQHGSQAQRYLQGRTPPSAASPSPAPPAAATAQRPVGKGYGQTNPKSYSPGNYSAGRRTATYGSGSPYSQTGMPSRAGTVRQYAGRPNVVALGLGSSFGTATRGENGEYEVQPNDSYWAISHKLYGSGSYFKALAEHNRDRYPRQDQLRIGDVIIAPSLTQLEQTYPGLVPKPSRRELVRSRNSTVSMTSQHMGGRTYVVEEGDTLSDIARFELGKASRWVEIYELNRDRLGGDFDYLVPGTLLAMPGGGPIDTLTQRPGSVYHR